MRAKRASVGSGPRKERSPAPSSPRAPADDAHVAALVGVSAAAQELRERVLKVARSETRVVLLQGETGSGKDLVARAIHAESARAERELVAINCSAVPEGMLETELFGHEAGAFTDARHAKRGLLEAADGGTLFLDEVAELGPGVQAKLLRVLEEQSFRRLGATEATSVDVRFVAATNVELPAAVQAGRFRSDLFYRLSLVTLEVPPLRERPEDVPVLAAHFLERFARRFHKQFEGFEEAALERLCAHPWPGNVRELKNAVERVVLLEDGPLVRADQLLPAPRGTLAPAPRAPATKAARAAEPAGAPAEGEELRDLEVRALVKALEQAEGNRSRAAELLGVSRDTVRHWMQRYGVRVEVRVVVDNPRGARRARR